jgi:hypothetical protein
VYDPLRGTGGPEIVRRDADVLERESEREKKRRVDDERLGGGGLITWGESGGVMGPRSSLSRFTAPSHSVHGWVCEGATWPQPLCCV